MSKVSQKYLERVMRAAIKSGVPLGGVEIRPDGTVALFAHGNNAAPVSTLDEELAQWRKSHGDH